MSVREATRGRGRARRCLREAIVLVFLAAATLASARRARACAACAAADPTLPSSGAEQPFQGRLRLTGDARVTSSRAAGFSGSVFAVSERRVDLGVGYAPSDDLLLELKAPLYQRETVDLDRDRRGAVLGLGDLEATASYAVWKSAPSRVRRRFGVVFGTKAPTARTEYAPGGEVLPASLQPGCASIAVEAGAYYVLARGPWSWQTNLFLILPPFAVRDAPHAGDSLRLASTVQLQPTRAFAARLGVLGRVDGAGEYGDDDDPSSGGALGYLSSEIVLAPVGDLVVSVGAWFPVLQALRGEHREGTIGVLTAAYDF